jgi:hypothetical protein
MRDGGVDLTSSALLRLLKPYNPAQMSSQFDRVEFFDAFLTVSAQGYIDVRGEEVLVHAWEIRMLQEHGTYALHMYHSVVATTLIPLVGASAMVRTLLAPFARLSLVRSLSTETIKPTTMLRDLQLSFKVVSNNSFLIWVTQYLRVSGGRFTPIMAW